MPTGCHVPLLNCYRSGTAGKNSNFRLCCSKSTINSAGFLEFPVLVASNIMVSLLLTTATGKVDGIDASKIKLFSCCQRILEMTAMRPTS